MEDGDRWLRAGYCTYADIGEASGSPLRRAQDRTLLIGFINAAAADAFDDFSFDLQTTFSNLLALPLQRQSSRRL